MEEILIMKFKLPLIRDLATVEAIAILGYRKTGNKFNVLFSGSKGYISNIEIFCEGYQKEDNIIWVEKLENKNKTLRNVTVNIFHSNEHGVRVSIGKDKPNIVN